MSEPEWSLPFNRAELIARVERLEAALKSIANGEGAGGLAETERLQEIARAALTSTETTVVPDPRCQTPGCQNFVESSEDYCTDCLDAQSDRKAP